MDGATWLRTEQVPQFSALDRSFVKPCFSFSKTHCDIVLQYMCNDANPGLRDGTPDDLDDAATDRVPDNAEESKNQVFLQETAEPLQV